MSADGSLDGAELSVDDLMDDVPFDPNAAPSTGVVAIQSTPAYRSQEAAAQIQEQHAKQSRQNTLWRRILFWGVSLIVAAFVVLEGVAIAAYLRATEDLDPIVMSTWFAASAVQIIGLLLVITRHLFPGDSDKQK